MLSHKEHKDVPATKVTKHTKGRDMTYDPVPPETENVATEVIGAAIEVHRHLGPGFLERICQEAFCLELAARRIAFEREGAITDVPQGRGDRRPTCRSDRGELRHRRIKGQPRELTPS
jgi:hypothetical protein